MSPSGDGCLAHLFLGRPRSRRYPKFNIRRDMPAPPSDEELKLGAEAVAKVRSLEATEQEKLYVEAIGALFDDAENAAHRERAIRYEKAMATVHEQNPDDK